jgi:hypothetical protein
MTAVDVIHKATLSLAGLVSLRAPRGCCRQKFRGVTQLLRAWAVQHAAAEEMRDTLGAHCLGGAPILGQLFEQRRCTVGREWVISRIDIRVLTRCVSKMPSAMLNAISRVRGSSSGEDVNFA